MQTKFIMQVHLLDFLLNFYADHTNDSFKLLQQLNYQEYSHFKMRYGTLLRETK